MIKIKEIQKEVEDLKNYLEKKYKLNPIKIKVKDINSGRAIYKSRFISIPLWAYDRGINYFYWYVIHEVCHFICNDTLMYNAKHSDLFKNKERELLKDFGLIPIYARAYVKELLSNSGEVLYTRKAYSND
jgi:predicted SprT family Zn-dependent metalloprotease